LHQAAKQEQPITTELPSIGQLSVVISQAAVPAFLLGALAAFIAVLISRLKPGHRSNDRLERDF
jgi:hypothetical protein